MKVLLFLKEYRNSSSRFLLIVISLGLGIFWLASLLLFVNPDLISASRTPTTTYLVTTNEDSDDGTCDGHCTLREAINATQNNSGPDTILFNLLPTSRTVTLTSSLPILTDTLTIDGSNVISLTLNGSQLSQFQRVFSIQEPGIVTITQMSLVSKTNSYAIYNEGALNLTQLLIAGNEQGVRNGGTLAVNEVTFEKNILPVGCGGGLHNFGVLTITTSIFRENMAENGGGLCNFSGIVSIEGTTFNDNSTNSSGGLGGAIVNTRNGAQWPSMEISQSYFFNNVATGAGGAILSETPLAISNSSFISNAADYVGGGIAAFSNAYDSSYAYTTITSTDFFQIQ